MKRRTVKILTGTRGGMVNEYEVPAIAVCGALCVTKFYKYDALFAGPEWDRAKGYRLTHIPSGYCVFDTNVRMTKVQAVAVMKRLAALDGWEAPVSAISKNKALKKAVREIEAEMEKKD